MGNSANKIVFNIGKQILKKIIGPITTSKVEYVTVNECSGESCLFYKSDNEYAKTYCTNFCPKAHVVKPVVKRVINLNSISGPIINPRGKFTPKAINGNIHSFITLRNFNIKNSIRLSLTQIKQMITLYSFCDSNGIIKGISKKQIASVMGCTEKTVENNNILLAKIGFVSIFPREKGELSIIVNNYKEQHQKYGGGYIVMSNDMLSALMQLSNVNALRIAIQAVVKNDMNSVLNHDTKFSTKEIKSLLPSYIYTRKAITKIIDVFSTLTEKVFNWKEDNNGFIVDIDKALDGKTIKKEKSIVFESEIITAISKNVAQDGSIDEETLKEKLSADIADLVAMSFEYGVDIVKSFASEAFAIKETIRNFGAYVRQLICNFYLDGVTNNL